MATDVRIHFGLEAIGAHRALVWSGFGLLSSWLTVNAVD
jgi:hypothetical protein